MTRVAAALGVIALLVAAGATKAADEKKPKRAPETMFKQLDADNDGKLSADEFKKLAEMGKGKLKDNPAAADKLFKRLDADADGKISLEEFKKFAELRKKKTDKP